MRAWAFLIALPLQQRPNDISVGLAIRQILEGDRHEDDLYKRLNLKNAMIVAAVLQRMADSTTKE